MYIYIYIICILQYSIYNTYIYIYMYVCMYVCNFWLQRLEKWCVAIMLNCQNSN